jgi:hypothetical protein
VFEDAQAEKQAIMEMITAVTGFVQHAMPIIQQEPLIAPLMFELLSLGIRAVKEGRRIEEVIEQTQQAILQKIQETQQNPQPPQPTPDVMAKLQLEDKRVTFDKEEKDRRFALDAEKQAHDLHMAQAQHAMAAEQHEMTKGTAQFDQHLKARQQDHAERQHQDSHGLAQQQHADGQNLEQMKLADAQTARAEQMAAERAAAVQGQQA